MATGIAGTLTELAKYGILGVLLGLFITLYILLQKTRTEERKQYLDGLQLERDKVDKAADKLYELGMATVKTNTEFNATLQSVEKDIDEIRRTKA